MAVTLASAVAAQTSSPFAPLPLQVESPADNPSTPEKVALGKLLFWDPILSGGQDVACASCHHHAGADSRSARSGPSSFAPLMPNVSQLRWPRGTVGVLQNRRSTSSPPPLQPRRARSTTTVPRPCTADARSRCSQHAYSDAPFRPRLTRRRRMGRNEHRILFQSRRRVQRDVSAARQWG